MQKWNCQSFRYVESTVNFYSVIHVTVWNWNEAVDDPSYTIQTQSKKIDGIKKKFYLVIFMPRKYQKYNSSKKCFFNNYLKH